MRPTLKDIAARAGLSIAAISMALRDHRSIAAATIARVKRHAAALGYSPDPALSALAAYRMRLRVRRDFSVIALVSNWSRPDEWLRRRSAEQLIAGATERTRTLGYTLQQFWAREAGMSPTRFSGMLAARGIRGVILAPFERPGDRFELDWDQFAVVTVERPALYTRFHHIVPNYFADMLLVWSQLRIRGYSRIGLVLDGGLAERAMHQWEAAHLFEQSRGSSERVPTLVVGEANRVRTIRAWLRRVEPAAVISRCDGVLEAAEAEGLLVPRDLGYASLNVIDDAPDVSGVLQQRDAMGATAVDVLNSLLHRNSRGANALSLGTQIDGSWQEGRTLRRATRPT